MLACWTFLLIIAGALVTSNDAGLSVPDWPTSFGSWYKIPKLVGGVKFEHTHRMIAQVAGLLTIILAVWTWRAEKRRWMRILGFVALGTVIAQGILGGLTVLFFLPPPVSSAHAALAQTFFCLAVAMAVFTGQKWVEEQPRVEFDQRRPSLFTLTLALHLCAVCAAHSGSHVPPSRHELVAACGACRRRFVCSGMDGHSGLDGVFEYRGRPAAGDPDALAGDCSTLPGIHRLPDARRLGKRRRAT